MTTDTLKPYGCSIRFDRIAGAWFGYSWERVSEWIAATIDADPAMADRLAASYGI